MNNAHYHLFLNHLPIIFPLAGLLVLLAGLIMKSEIVQRTAYAVLIAGSLLTIPAYTTGEGAEEVIENIAGVDEKIIETHEEKAEVFAVLSYILGAAALLGLWASVKGKSFAGSLTYVVVALAAVTLFFAKQTGTTGGEIRHPEIRQGFVAPPENSELEKESD